MKNYSTCISIKKKLIALACFFSSITTAFSQTITLFPNPNAADYGFYGGMVSHNNHIYFHYNSQQGNRLAKFTDTSYTLINTVHSLEGSSVTYNASLYYIVQASPNRLGRLNADGSITLISNPDNGIGFTGQPIVFEGKLYGTYLLANGTMALAVYDGSSTSLLPKPDAGQGFTQNPLIHNNQLFWIYQNVNQQNVLTRFDGSTLTVIAPNGASGGIRSELAVFNNDIFFSLNDSLGRYNGSTINGIALPFGCNMNGNPVMQGSRLWFKTRIFSQDWQLAYYDGAAVQLFGQTYPYNIGFYDPLLYNNRLYVAIDNVNGYRSLAYIEGNNLTVIPRLGAQDPGYTGSPVVYNDALYFAYFMQGENGQRLARYDGEFLSVLPHPASGTSLYTNNTKPLLHNGSLYVGYVVPNNGTHVLPARFTDSVTVAATCPGSTIELNSNLNGASYQWQIKNGNSFINLSNSPYYSGVNSPTLLISNLPAAFAGNKYRSVVPGSTGEVHSIQLSNHWIGPSGGSWDNPANWSCGVLPDSKTTVTISYGNVVVTAPASIQCLQLQAPARLTIAPGVAFTISGNNE